MAIRDFGTSLLANVRQRKDAQARDARNRAKKQQRKDALQGLLFKGAMSMGNAILRDKSNKFLESEQFYKENMQFKKGYDIANEYITNEKAARNNELGYDAYWTKVAPEGAVETAMTEKYGASSLYNTTDWKQMRSSLMRTMGEEARKNHEEGLVNAQSFINKAGSGGAEFYSNFAKEARPTTITGLITNTVRSTIGGKDLNVASREITRKGYLKDAEALIAYDKTWDQTGSNQISSFFADTTKTLKSKAPVLTQEYAEEEGLFGKKTVVRTKAKYPNGDSFYVDENGKKAMSDDEAQDFKKYNGWVAKHSTDTQDAKAQQQVGMLAISKHATEEDKKFFNAIAKETGKKFSGNDRDKAVAQKNKSIQAHIAGLKIMYRDGYGMGQETSERLAVAMYRNQEEFIKESNPLGANPFSHGKTFGTIITMAEQQALPNRPRNFSNFNIAEVIASPAGKKDLFKDYRQLTPKSMDKYDELVERTGNQIVIQAHKEIKGLAQFSNKNPTITDLGKIEELYNESLVEEDVSLTTINTNLEGLQNNEPESIALDATPDLLSSMPRPPALPKFSSKTDVAKHKQLYGGQQKDYLKILKAQKTLQNNIAMTTKQGKTTSYGITSAQKSLNNLYTDYMNKYGE
jgi:hypothetical protein